MTSFLKGSSFLLVSSRPTHRSSLRKVLCDLGAENQFIDAASDFVQAKERLSKSGVNVVITDEDIGEKFSSIDLLPLHEKNTPRSNDRLFILMAADVSVFFKSEFTLRGGDLIISKPFTNATFTEAFLEIVKIKNAMAPDQKASLDIQDALKANKKDEALRILSSMKNPNSQSALFCKGLVYDSDQNFSAAYDAYTLAMAHKIDLPSLVNIVHTGVHIKKYRELGDVVERWVKDFPLHNKSVQNIARVVVYNQKFELFDTISSNFSQKDFEDELVKIPLAAGLVMAGYAVLEVNKEKAIAYALKGIEYSGFKPIILLKGLEVLVSAGATEEAEKIYQLLMARAPYSEDRILDVRIQALLFPKEKVLDKCLELISKNTLDIHIFQVALNCSRDIGRDTRDLLVKAQKAFPEMNFAV